MLHSRMRMFDEVVLKVRRGDTGAARTLRDVYRWAQRWNLPDGPVSRRMFGALYRAFDAYTDAREMAGAKLLYEPMVRSRFHKVGRNLHVTSLPYVRGHARVTVGDDCSFGYFSIRSGRFLDAPELTFGTTCRSR